jgi:hypothetical protein
MKAAIILFADTDRPGACVYCSRAYGVTDQVETAGVPFLDEFRGHPSIRSLVAAGHAVITF